MPDLEEQLVDNHEQWYATRPDYVARMTQRASRYLFHIVEEVEKRGMPTELALLPFIESAFNPGARSSAKASGMWQFIPSTGRDFRLQQNIFRDDRRDIVASTRAALDYLEKLYEMFGDWRLALAAYNWGEGNVRRAIARNEKAGLPTDYTHLRMPAETRHYVPKLQAVENIVDQPDAFSLVLPVVENHPYFLTVLLEHDLDIELAAKFADMPLDEFKTLNPQMNRPVILAAGTPQLLLPYDNARAFVQALAEHDKPYATWTAWVVPKTMRPVEAARRVGMSEAELRNVNGIPPGKLIKAGSTLLVPRGMHHKDDVSEHLADNATLVLIRNASPVKRLDFRVGRATSVAAVARRYKVSPAQVAAWNGVEPHSSFRPGQRVVIFVPQRKREIRAVGHRASFRGATTGRTKPSTSRDRPAAARR